LTVFAAPRARPRDADGVQTWPKIMLLGRLSRSGFDGEA
jgi:hypothetical protein